MPIFELENPGINLDTGSAGESLPASTSIIAATLVIGFVIK